MAHVALLPKGSGVPRQGLDKRPIVLLSEIYRLWAAARRRTWTQWALLWDSPSRVAAADQAWDLAAAAVIARARGRNWRGWPLIGPRRTTMLAWLSLGKSLSGPEFPFRSPGQCWRLMPSSAEWSLRVRWVRSHLPTHGIAPGCPLAVDIMALGHAPVDSQHAAGGAAGPGAGLRGRSHSCICKVAEKS